MIARGTRFLLVLVLALAMLGPAVAQGQETDESARAWAAYVDHYLTLDPASQLTERAAMTAEQREWLEREVAARLASDRPPDSDTVSVWDAYRSMSSEELRERWSDFALDLTLLDPGERERAWREIVEPWWEGVPPRDREQLERVITTHVAGLLIFQRQEFDRLIGSVRQVTASDEAWFELARFYSSLDRGERAHLLDELSEYETHKLVTAVGYLVRGGALGADEELRSDLLRTEIRLLEGGMDYLMRGRPDQPRDRFWQRAFLETLPHLIDLIGRAEPRDDYWHDPLVTALFTMPVFAHAERPAIAHGLSQAGELELRSRIHLLIAAYHPVGWHQPADAGREALGCAGNYSGYVDPSQFVPMGIVDDVSVSENEISLAIDVEGRATIRHAISWRGSRSEIVDGEAVTILVHYRSEANLAGNCRDGTLVLEGQVAGALEATWPSGRRHVDQDASGLSARATLRDRHVHGNICRSDRPDWCVVFSAVLAEEDEGPTDARPGLAEGGVEWDVFAIYPYHDPMELYERHRHEIMLTAVLTGPPEGRLGIEAEMKELWDLWQRTMMETESEGLRRSRSDPGLIRGVPLEEYAEWYRGAEPWRRELIRARLHPWEQQRLDSPW